LFDSNFKQRKTQTVIASEAKQSMAAAKKKDGLLRFARNDEKPRHAFTISPRKAPELCMNFSPL